MTMHSRYHGTRLLDALATPGSAMMDRTQLADFLRRRREVLQPEDVGLSNGLRRRTRGLRREEVAALGGMSVDYLSRLEQERGPQPSQQMLAAIARGLRLSVEKRDHLFGLAGRGTPDRNVRTDHVSPALLRVLDRLDDTPAQVVTNLEETLAQNRLSIALLGNQMRFTGLERSLAYRWFTNPEARRIHLDRDHSMHSRIFTSQLRTVFARNGRDLRVRTIVQRLNAESAEFAELWNLHEVGLDHSDQKTIIHPGLGEIHVHCQVLLAVDESQSMLVYTATPGTESYDKLQRLSDDAPIRIDEHIAAG